MNAAPTIAIDIEVRLDRAAVERFARREDITTAQAIARITELLEERAHDGVRYVDGVEPGSVRSSAKMKT